MDYSFFNEVVFGINNPDMLSNYNSFYNKTDINDLYAVDRDNLVQNIYSGFGDNLKAIIDVRARQWTESNDQGGSSVSYSQMVPTSLTSLIFQPIVIFPRWSISNR